MNDIRSTLKFNNYKMEEPGFYYGDRLKRKELNSFSISTMSSTDYVKFSVENVERKLKEKQERLPARVVIPTGQGYYPNMD